MIPSPWSDKENRKMYALAYQSPLWFAMNIFQDPSSNQLSWFHQSDYTFLGTERGSYRTTSMLVMALWVMMLHHGQVIYATPNSSVCHSYAKNKLFDMYEQLPDLYKHNVDLHKPHNKSRIEFVNGSGIEFSTFNDAFNANKYRNIDLLLIDNLDGFRTSELADIQWVKNMLRDGTPRCRIMEAA